MSAKFELDRSIRENEILKIHEGTPVATGVVLPIRTNQTFNVYKIPVKYLIYNHLNDRFASKRREHKFQTGEELTNDSIESMKLIEDFIWESNVSSNKETLKDIAKKGQRKYGVITTDGRIIDGNRRATLIRRIFFSDEGEFPNVNKEDFRYFKAVILPGDIDNDEMITLETQIQMGEDEKVEYNAIEKYLKIDKLSKSGIEYHDIVNMINSMKNKSDVEKKHKTYLLMEDYLEFIDAPNRFSLIEKNEDHFLNLQAVLTAYENGKYETNWVPQKSDIVLLKQTAFSYIRKGHEGKDYRNIMGGPKNAKGIFSNQEVWKKFVQKHDKVVDNADKKVKHAIKENPHLTLNQRENIWKNEADSGLKYALERGKEAIKNTDEKERPHRLIEGALDKINLVNVDLLVENFDEKRDKDTYVMIKNLHEAVDDIRKRIINDVYKKN